MPKQVMDYSKTIIYKIVCNDLEIKETYVGHTTNMVKRRCCHKHSCNNELNKGYNMKIYQTIRANGGWDNWSMIQICEFPCKNYEEARTEERRHYELLNASLNTYKPIISQDEIIENRKEYGKEHYEKNREDVLQYMRDYYDENREARIEYRKGYYDENKDKVLQHMKEYHIANKEVILDKKKEYRIANREVILDKFKIKYTCGCGSIVRHRAKARHEKCQKHLEYVKHNPLVVNTL